jgi:hypothetical protein
MARRAVPARTPAVRDKAVAGPPAAWAAVRAAAANLLSVRRPPRAVRRLSVFRIQVQVPRAGQRAAAAAAVSQAMQNPTASRPLRAVRRKTKAFSRDQAAVRPGRALQPAVGKRAEARGLWAAARPEATVPPVPPVRRQAGRRMPEAVWTAVLPRRQRERGVQAASVPPAVLPVRVAQAAPGTTQLADSLRPVTWGPADLPAVRTVPMQTAATAVRVVAAQ